MATDPTSRTEFKCDICDESFETISELEEHKSSHMTPAERQSIRDREIRGDIGAAGLPMSPN